MHQKYNSISVYDPTYPDLEHTVFKRCGWTENHRNANEATSINTPEHRWKEVDICMIVDSDHSRDKKSCNSRSNFLICINTALVQLNSKNCLQ